MKWPRAHVRAAITDTFKGDPDLDAFVCDYFPKIHERWTIGMERGQKLTILMTHASLGALVEALESRSPGSLSARLPASAQRSADAARSALRTGLKFALAAALLALALALATVVSDLPRAASLKTPPGPRDDVDSMYPALVVIPGGVMHTGLVEPLPVQTLQTPKRSGPRHHTNHPDVPPPAQGVLVIASLAAMNVEISRDAVPVRQWKLLRAQDVVALEPGHYVVTCWRTKRKLGMAVERTVEVKAHAESTIRCFPD